MEKGGNQQEIKKELAKVSVGADKSETSALIDKLMGKRPEAETEKTYELPNQFEEKSDVLFKSVVKEAGLDARLNGVFSGIHFGVIMVVNDILEYMHYTSEAQLMDKVEYLRSKSIHHVVVRAQPIALDIQRTMSVLDPTTMTPVKKILHG